MSDARPWHRRRKEPQKAWAAFVEYRDLGADRSLAIVARSLGKSKALLERWSRTWDWVARCRAYDDEIDRRRLEKRARSVEEMQERQIEAGMVMQGIAALELEKLAREVEKAPELRRLSVDQVLRLAREGASLERLNRGEPGEIVEERSKPLDLSNLSLDDAIKLKELLKRARGER